MYYFIFSFIFGPSVAAAFNKNLYLGGSALHRGVKTHNKHKYIYFYPLNAGGSICKGLLGSGSRRGALPLGAAVLQPHKGLAHACQRVTGRKKKHLLGFF